MNSPSKHNKLRVALLAGGKSGEREVSLEGARDVLLAFDKAKYEVTRYDPATDLARIAAAAAAEIDVAFILLHGPFGEDGSVQGFLDLLGIPYQGSGILGSAIAMNKHIAKMHYREAGLTVPEWRVVRQGDLALIDRILDDVPYPVMIKPACQGSSLGMAVAKTRDEAKRGLMKAFEYDREVMIEEFIDGREITVGVLGNDELVALPVVEIIPNKEYAFFDYEAKYKKGATLEVCPAEIDEDLAQKAKEHGVRAHKALCLRGYSRTDMIIRGDDLYVLETNTIPGMTPTSLLPQAAKAHGLSFPELIDRLIELALDKGP